jgi:ElaB/YqjD/DUF883 family membrane-anchored ribosome-binding protein
MSADPPQVAAARIEAEKARAQLMETAHELQQRLSPAVLAQNAWEGAKSKGADLAEEAVDAVRRRPAIAGGIAAAITLFLAREPLKDAAGKLTRKAKSRRKPPKAPTPRLAKAPRRPRALRVRVNKKLKTTETIA